MVKKSCLLFLIWSSFVFAQDLTPEYEGKQEDKDMDALQKWIREKRLVTVKELGGDLSLSGEVRVEFQQMNEVKNSIRQRGRGGATTKPDYALDVEVNLMLDYRSERTWASIKLEFDNDMGVQSGYTNKIALEKAFFGGRMISGDTFSLDGELGRRNLSNVFESQIEFSAIYDGGHLKFSKASDMIGDFYVTLGSLLVDDKHYHFAYVGEIGLLRIGNTGFFAKYSCIDWRKHYSNSPTNLTAKAAMLRYDFVVSQALVGYQFNEERWLHKMVKFYAAGLCNTAAEKNEFVGHTKQNLACYLGFAVGKIMKAGDWAIDTNVQYVQAQSIPDFDSNGIKRGNVAGVGFYTANLNGTGALNTKSTAVGSENFKGFQIETLYAFTNSLTMLYNFKISRNASKHIGPRMRFKMFEIEMIYAF